MAADNKTTNQNPDFSQTEKLLMLNLREQRKIRLLLHKKAQNAANREIIATIRLLSGILLTVSLTLFFQSELTPDELRVLLLFVLMGGLLAFISVIYT